MVAAWPRCLTLALMAVLSAGCYRSASVPTSPQIDASALTGTDVVPHVESALRDERNYVYCGTFQLAWDQMKELLKGPIELEGNPPLADPLNHGTFDKKNLSPGSYLVRGGRLQDGALDDIRAEMRREFPSARLQVPDATDTSGGLVAYAYLTKMLAFSEAFDRNRHPIEFRFGKQSVKVRSFGVDQDAGPNETREHKLEGQVSVRFYAGPDDFVLRLATKASRDELILAKVPPHKTLGDTIAAAGKRIRKGSSEFPHPWSCSEALAIPLIDFNVRRRFSELEKPLKNKKLSVTLALQDILFHLDETGARVESQVTIEVKSTLMPGRPPHREFVFDKPFLVMMQEIDASAPYFAAWIGNAELMTRW
jgi:hypothetical protein